MWHLTWVTDWNRIGMALGNHPVEKPHADFDAYVGDMRTKALSLGALSYHHPDAIDDPTFFPGLSREVLASFPPSLLWFTSRDYSSAEFISQTELKRVGVHVELRGWEGLGHCFYANPDIPESRELYGEIADFFDRHLL